MMMSVSTLKNDCELDIKSDSAGGNRSGAGVSEGDVDYDERPVDSGGGGSGEIGVSSRGEEQVDLRAPVDARVSGNERSKEVRGRVCMESDGERGVDKDMCYGADFEVKNEETASVDQFDVKNEQSGIMDDRSCAQNELLDAKNGLAGRRVEPEKHTGFQYKSLLSEFDDYLASEKNMGMSRAIKFGFEVGDMVWGKVKSHPWWPGHIFNEAFATASVRHSRRDGLVLVAFFGDSSYGWFDPAELVPFDSYFTEKSQQTNSRTFIKAVEEAVDELSRRCGLGLACKCRNNFNFRPTTVQGYYAVDVPNYEPGGVYSDIQIRKARDGFHPGETLDFIKELALAPRASDQKDIEFVKKKATVFAYRKAVFEEFDETYAQAFGMQGARSSRDLTVSEQPIKMPRLAPFSGPLVIAETLGGGKSSVKSPKVKDHSKKDRYLFKRREESSNSKVHQTHQGASSSPSLAYMEGSPALGAGDFVLQKRTPDIAVKPEIPAISDSGGSMSMDGAYSSQDVSGKGETRDNTSVHSSDPVTQYANLVKKPSLDMEKDPSEIDPGSIMGSSGTSWTTPDVKDGGSLSSEHEGKEVVDLKHEVDVNVSLSCEQPEPYLLKKAEGVHGALSGAHSSPVDAKRAVGVKKAKAVKKRPVGESGSDISLPVEKKKKKKRELGSQTSSDHPQKRLATGKSGSSVGKLPGKSPIGLGRKDDSRLDHQKKNDATNNSMPSSVWTMLTVGEVNVPQLLTDLQALALIPFHGVERNSPTIVRDFFGKFRSDAFQKSQKNVAPSQATEAGVSEVRPSQSVASDVVDMVGEGAEGSGLPSKPVKGMVRPNDPTKAGRKRGPSDRQEENAAKKVKRMNDLKSMAADKKGNLKTPEGEGRKTVAPVSAPPPKTVARRVEALVKAAEPTMLVMKFPPQTSLPSVAELKARFARFGPLDHMAIRVFWKTSMCRVVFRHKRDAQNAFKYASVNSSLFGNVNVRYYVREMGVEPAEGAEAGKGSSNIDKDLVSERPRLHQPVQQPAVQLKSILKRSNGEEVTGSSNGGRGTPRVKFMLGGEETATTSSGEQPGVGSKNNNYNNNASFADGGVGAGAAPSSTTITSVATMDFNSKNFQKVNPSPSPLPAYPTPTPTPPPPPPLANHLHHHHHEPVKAPPYNTPHHHAEAEAARNICVQNAPSAGVDISEQMVSLLTRCNEVVSNLSGLLGYVPYHPL